MIFSVQLLEDVGRNDASRHGAPIVEFEADDLYSVILRTRIILAAKGYEPSIGAFQITANGGQVLYYERRGVGGGTSPRC